MGTTILVCTLNGFTLYEYGSNSFCGFIRYLYQRKFDGFSVQMEHQYLLELFKEMEAQTHLVFVSRDWCYHSDLMKNHYNTSGLCIFTFVYQTVF